MVAYIMSRSDGYCQYPIACLALWIEPAISHEQIHFFHDTGGNLVGYMTWAMLAEDTERRLLRDPEFLIHISEWNEGDFLWILDFVVVNGDANNAIRQAYSLFPEITRAKSVRRDRNGVVRKMTTWKSRPIEL